jgi:hypothetical protein
MSLEKHEIPEAEIEAFTEQAESLYHRGRVRGLIEALTNCCIHSSVWSQRFNLGEGSGHTDDLEERPTHHLDYILKGVLTSFEDYGGAKDEAAREALQDWAEYLTEWSARMRRAAEGKQDTKKATPVKG